MLDAVRTHRFLAFQQGKLYDVQTTSLFLVSELAEKSRNLVQFGSPYIQSYLRSPAFFPPNQSIKKFYNTIIVDIKIKL